MVMWYNHLLELGFTDFEEPDDTKETKEEGEIAKTVENK